MSNANKKNKDYFNDLTIEEEDVLECLFKIDIEYK